MHILDTDTLTHLYAGHSRVVERLRNLDDPDVCATFVNKIELLRGRFDFVMKASTGAELLRAQQWLIRTEELLDQIIILSFDEEAAAWFDRLKMRPGLRKIGRVDLLIASMTLANQAVLVTRNIRHFQKIPELTVVNWVD